MVLVNVVCKQGRLFLLVIKVNDPCSRYKGNQIFPAFNSEIGCVISELVSEKRQFFLVQKFSLKKRAKKNSVIAEKTNLFKKKIQTLDKKANFLCTPGDEPIKA